jgi:RNA polymerase sigma-70 factor, ECF subfamily
VPGMIDPRDPLATAGGSRPEYASVGESELIALGTYDPAAFTELYRRYADRVYRYLLAYAAEPEAAADLTQHVFARCLEALPRYQDRGYPFSAWLFKIARNAATDEYRHQTRLVPWDHVGEAQRAAVGSGPEERTLRAERHERVRVLVEELDPAKKELVVLRFGSGLSTREIAAVIGKKPATVQKQLRRTLQLLKERCDELQI